MNLIILILSSGLLWAQGTDPSSAEEIARFQDRIENTLSTVRSFKSGCPTCGLFTAGDSSAMSVDCRKTYQKIFKIKDRAAQESGNDRFFDVSLAFGYMDFAGQTADNYASYGFQAALMSRCQPGEFACGFTRHPDDANLFYKQIKILGPDGVLRLRTVRITIQSSSVSNIERDNRTELRDQQNRKSAETQKFFLSGLQNSDVVFYVGHARDGGGPDFSPPVLIKGSQTKADYGWYHKNQPGVHAMVDALGAASHPAKIVGIFACYAEDHFSDLFKQILPGSGVILSGQQEFEASEAQAAASLDSILGLKCADQFQQSVDLLKNVNKTVITGVHLERVFGEN